MNKSNPQKSVGITILMLGLLGLVSCHKKVHTKPEEAHFLATTPLREDTEIPRGYVCQIRACQHIELRTLERGYLEKVFVDEGQDIRKGQSMFKVMPALYQAELNRAKAEAEFAQIEYQNTAALQKDKIVSDQEVAMAKAKLSKATANAELASAHLAWTEIKAPFDGIMDRLHVRQGSLLDEGELLTSLSDNRKMWVYFNVTEAEYLGYQSRGRVKSMPVKLRMANGQLFDHPGVVDTVEGEFHNATGTIAFRATFSNPDGVLRHGQTGEVLVFTEHKDALLIPQKATFEILDKKYVFVVDEENRIRSREITIAAELPHLYVVASGLGAEEKFLIEGLRRVRDGDLASITLQPPQKVFTTLDVPAK